MRRRAPILALCLTIGWSTCVGFSGGCDLFRPATAEGPPPSAGSGIHVDLTDPELTLATMSRAVEKHAIGLETWMDCLADPSRDNGLSFVATLDPAAVLLYNRGDPSPWGRDLEQLFYPQFISVWTTGEDSLYWSPIDNLPDPQYLGGDTKVLIRHYELWNILQQSGEVTRQLFAIGYAQITFRQVARGWVLLSWEDHVDPDVTVSPPADQQEFRCFSWRRLEYSGL